jgi:hypothetical protein
MDSYELGELESIATSALSHTDTEDWHPNDATETPRPQRQRRTCTPSDPTGDIDYLLKLEGPVSSSECLAKILGLSKLPIAHDGESSDDGHVARFCRIDANARQSLLAWAHDNDFCPLIISQFRAPKGFSSVSFAPKIGLESTLPQHRLQSPARTPRPAQDEYPVWYFFYGTLAGTDLLRDLLSELDGEDTTFNLLPATIRGGMLKTVGCGRYKGLVNGSSDSIVHGHAFLVQSKEHEDVLCVYESRAYEVVRCEITMEGDLGRRDVVPGCTFRFRGRVD